MLARQQSRHTRGETAERLTVGVDDQPLALDLTCPWRVGPAHDPCRTSLSLILLGGPPSTTRRRHSPCAGAIGSVEGPARRPQRGLQILRRGASHPDADERGHDAAHHLAQEGVTGHIDRDQVTLPAQPDLVQGPDRWSDAPRMPRSHAVRPAPRGVVHGLDIEAFPELLGHSARAAGCGARSRWCSGTPAASLRGVDRNPAPPGAAARSRRPAAGPPRWPDRAPSPGSAAASR